ncbi:NAD(P)/FAD-dependent oxidoreductase [Staphylothermus hellenicus]|uniref:FAD-dependent pyridine nucleotide-disulfide oxidoreductase n=1 Tax=Staphylothermus hellenicus (strain DSM 12710 / JCM 10830 / BK20S6-10-b1 / P8) TaxID=591019 RepID=D7DBY8_STAHD|nr:FAD-dependent oxidoreductase [Staphylothermus hellenicus]ADI31685.1 FAD-dependent pyridine nucleotide-disulfide oxidoreductase [Staphylothermus hellenicus DSM 12710]
MRKEYDALIIGGGPAGLAAAIRLAEKGYDPLIIEARDRLGGIPLQCIHPGFGLHYFHEDLTGPEFIYRFINRVEQLGISYITNAYVEKIINESIVSKKVSTISPHGNIVFEGKALIYAAGARERHRYEIGIPGPNIAGIYTAGEAQTMMDMYGIMPGKKVLIIGSGDVGLIMARRLVLEGAEVVGVVEILRYPSGLVRNIVQCLKDFSIPLMLQHMVTDIKAKNGRVSGAIISKVDETLKPIPGTEREIECDTIIIAAGLRPKVKLLKEIGVDIDPKTYGPVVNDYLETMNVPGIFVAGNALLINDYVDYAVEQGEWAAESTALHIEYKGLPTKQWRRAVAGENIRLIVPQYVGGEKNTILYIRVTEPLENVQLMFPEIGKSIPVVHALPSIMLRIRLRREEISKTTNKIIVEAKPYGQY